MLDERICGMTPSWMPKDRKDNATSRLPILRVALRRSSGFSQLVSCGFRLMDFSSVSEMLLRFLREGGRPYCFSCLRRSFPGLEVRRRILFALGKGEPLVIEAARCGICGRSRATVRYRPPA